MIIYRSTDVLDDETLDVFVHVLALEDELVLDDGALGGELGEEELADVLGGALHDSADVSEVGPGAPLALDLADLGHLHDELGLLRQLRLLVLQLSDDPFQKCFVFERLDELTLYHFPFVAGLLALLLLDATIAILLLSLLNYVLNFTLFIIYLLFIFIQIHIYVLNL